MIPSVIEPPLLDRLATWCADIRLDDLDANGWGMVRTALVDTLGVILAGSTFGGVRALRRAGVGDPPGPSLVIGTRVRTTAQDAALLNGVAAHALDYDDGNRKLGGHPSAVLVPTILALGEELGSAPTDVVVAYAAGFEAMSRIAEGINPAHYRRGWHPTSTLGVFGAAAAAARLLDLGPERMAAALAAAASMAAGVKANFGTMVKSLHVGHAARDGLLCAKLAAAGLTASRSALDGAQGFFVLYADDVDVEAIVSDRGPRANTRINTIKQYPCCQSTHCAATAAIALHSRLPAGDRDIRDVQVVVDPNRIPHTDRPSIRDAFEGKFSMQYVVARGLLDGRVGLDHFEGDADREPGVRELMTRVVLVAAPPGGAPNSFAAEVTVRTARGEKLTASADLDTIASMAEPPAGLWTKFADCAGRALPDDRVAALAAAAGSFGEVGDLGDLMQLTASAPRGRGEELQ
ncbi:MmgE/PrpD family protein [Saccharomonospora sp. NPDC046836]|uniref:MmgE/PrpD family protein n=1 Tax=Saccharomonospora sp. NPDC046836 TaxID=3156921 RepID=UPI0033E4981F